MREEGLLLYCIADNFDESFTTISGLDESHSLYAVKHRGMYGIVSVVYLEEYGEEGIKVRGEDINWITDKACTFMEIIQFLNEKTVLIPMKFFTILSNEDGVRNLIDEDYESFTHNMNKLRGRVELCVKVYCNYKIFKKTFTEEISNFKKSLEGESKKTAAFFENKCESELDGEIQDKTYKIADLIIKDSRRFYIEMKPIKLLAKEITGGREKMILNCAFLINDEEKENFFNYFKDMKEKYKSSGFSIECSGPWPPYDFCQ